MIVNLKKWKINFIYNTVPNCLRHLSPGLCNLNKKPFSLFIRFYYHTHTKKWRYFYSIQSNRASIMMLLLKITLWCNLKKKIRWPMVIQVARATLTNISYFVISTKQQQQKITIYFWYSPTFVHSFILLNYHYYIFFTALSHWWYQRIFRFGQYHQNTGWWGWLSTNDMDNFSFKIKIM